MPNSTAADCGERFPVRLLPPARRMKRVAPARGRGARASDDLKLLVRQSLELRVDLGHGPVLDLSRPGRIDRHVGGIIGGDAQIEREVGYEQRLLVAAEIGSCRKKQALGRAIIDEFVEIAKLSDNLAGLVDDDDLVRLVGRHPQIVVTVDHEPVRAVDAVDEDGWRAVRAAAHRNLHDRVVAGVGDEQDGLRLVEAQAVGAERRVARRAQQGILYPRRGQSQCASRAGFPDGASERIRHIDVSG